MLATQTSLVMAFGRGTPRFCRRQVQGVLLDIPNARSFTVKPAATVKSVERPPESSGPSALRRLPTANLLRNVFLGVFFTSPLLSKPGLYMLHKIANSRSALFNPDTNLMLRLLVKPLIYDQFCAGTNEREIACTKDRIKSIGYSGIILCYGKEIQVSKTDELRSTRVAKTNEEAEIEHFEKGYLHTLDMVGEGDWIGIKLTGAGPQVTAHLLNDCNPPERFTEAMNAIFRKAKRRNCRIWIDAEQQAVQAGIDRWTIGYMRRWNSGGEALVYNTIQAYLKSSRTKLKDQLALAEKEGWTYAIKLVRGAYIASDPRGLIHDTKADTDDSYNGIVRDVLSGRNLGFDGDQFPCMQLFLAGHNPDTIRMAIDLMLCLADQGKLRALPEFGQLQGMADELACELLEAAEQITKRSGQQEGNHVIPRVYKCLTWGSIQECMQYLVRRAVENSGGTARMQDGTAAYLGEIRRRITGFVLR